MCDAAKQFIEDCGPQLWMVSVAAVMLSESHIVEVDGVIRWGLLRLGSSYRLCNGQYTFYNKQGNRI